MKIDVTVYNDDEAGNRTIEVVEVHGAKELSRHKLEPHLSGGHACCLKLAADPTHHLIVRFKSDVPGEDNG